MLSTWLIGWSTEEIPKPDCELPQCTALIEGTVIRSSVTTPHQAALLRTTAGRCLDRSVPIAQGTLVNIQYDLPWQAHVRIVGVLHSVPRYHNPSPAFHWPSDNLKARVILRPWPKHAIRHLDVPWWATALHRVRRYIDKVLTQTLSHRASPLTRALVLGETSAVDRSSLDVLRHLGITHAIAVSGLHVTLSVGLMLLLLKRVLTLSHRLRARFDTDRIAYLGAATICPIYVLIAGASASAWRSGISTSLGWLLCALGRRPKPTDMLSATIVLFGVFDRSAITSIGFLLSTAATIALITVSTEPTSLFYSRTDEAESSIRSFDWKNTWRVQQRVLLATFPLVIACFGQVPWLCLLGNALAAPIITFIVHPLANLHLLIAASGWPGHWITGHLLDISTAGFYTLTQTLDTFAPAATKLELTPLQVTSLSVLCWVWLVKLPRSTTRWICTAAVLVCCASELILRHQETPRDHLRATFLDVGQGDSTLIDLPNGKLMVIDAGGHLWGASDPGKEVLIPLLKARRRHVVDIFVLTHAHPDHYGGLLALAASIPIKELWINDPHLLSNQQNTLLVRTIKNLIRRGTRVRTPTWLCDHPQTFAKARVTTLWPCPSADPIASENNRSIVLQIDYKKRRWLFTGDIEAEAESALLNERRLSHVDLLKVAHHGSKTSSTVAFLKTTTPNFAIISCGRANRFGHPHPITLSRLASRHTRVLTIAQSGGIVREVN